MTCER